MAFITVLRKLDGDPIIVNFDNVTTAERYEEGSIIEFNLVGADGPKHIIVADSLEEICGGFATPIMHAPAPAVDGDKEPAPQPMATEPVPEPTPEIEEPAEEHTIIFEKPCPICREHAVCEHRTVGKAHPVLSEESLAAAQKIIDDAPKSKLRPSLEPVSPTPQTPEELADEIVDELAGWDEPPNTVTENTVHHGGHDPNLTEPNNGVDPAPGGDPHAGMGEAVQNAVAQVDQESEGQNPPEQPEL